MPKKALIVLSILLWTQTLSGQIWDLILPAGTRAIEIPFEYENDFIIVNIQFNRIFPLRFIFDTGAEHTILTKREITDLLRINYDRRFTIIGSDMKTELYAYLARGITLKTPMAEFTNRAILVLEEDYFRFEEFSGVDVHGILGADVFRRFVVEINYERSVIRLHDPAHFKPPSQRFAAYPLEMARQKPYFYTCTSLEEGSPIETKLLLDTGASLGLLLYTNSHPDLHMPPNVIPSNIGMGLGGYLEGFLGKVQKVNLAGFAFQEVVTNFQEINPDIDSDYMNDRQGLVGNKLLSRFTVTIDYVRSMLYLEPNRDYDREFIFDRSGLTLTASGPNLQEFTVFRVLEGSPADEAGVEPGDVVKRINGLSSAFYSLQTVNDKFMGKVGKKIKLVLERRDERLQVEFLLRELFQ